MATDSSTGSTTSSTEGTGTESTTGQEEQGTQKPTVETTGQEQKPTAPVIDKDTKLPDDHPLVTTLATQKTKIGTLTSELQEANAKAARATQLEEDLAKRPTPEALTTLQNRNDRLEAFLSQVGGPLSKALDSRTFTRDLFETDKDIKDIVKTFLQSNPTATSDALGSAASAPAGGKANPNDLLRAAFNGSK